MLWTRLFDTCLEPVLKMPEQVRESSARARHVPDSSTCRGILIHRSAGRPARRLSCDRNVAVISRFFALIEPACQRRRFVDGARAAWPGRRIHRRLGRAEARCSLGCAFTRPRRARSANRRHGAGRSLRIDVRARVRRCGRRCGGDTGADAQRFLTSLGHQQAHP